MRGPWQHVEGLGRAAGRRVDSRLALLVNRGAAGSRGSAGSETQACPSEGPFQ